MVRKKSVQSERLLTKVELELMGILWKIQDGTVNQVLAHLPLDRKLAYTSVSTILRILEQKKVVGARKDGRGHTYYPLLTKKEYESTSLNHLLKKVFNGAPSALILRLLDDTQISKKEIESIRSMLLEKSKGGR